MPETAIVRLSPIALIPADCLPMTRGKELDAVRERRSAARGRFVSGLAMTALAAAFALIYGALASWIWLFNGPIFLAVFASLACAGLCTACFKLMDDVGIEYRSLRDATPSPELVEDASRERALAAAVREFDAQAEGWNVALARTAEADVGERFMGRLVNAREALERRRAALVKGIVSAWRTAAFAESVPRKLPPPQDRCQMFRVNPKSP